MQQIKTQHPVSDCSSGLGSPGRVQWKWIIPVFTWNEEAEELGGFCTGLKHCDALTFGKPIKVTVTPEDDTYKGDPALYVLSPLLPQGYPPKTADQLGPDVCLATDFYPKDGEMVLNTEGGPVKVETTAAAFSTTTKSYYFAGFSNKTIHSCQLHNSSSSNEADDLCEGIYPEKAKLNFYLLVMNAVRVVFTKTLAFNTILTIRAVLF